MKYYIDTCIWIDYWENRSDRFRPLGEFAIEFLNKCESNKDLIIISDVMYDELTDMYSIDTVNKVLEVVTNKLFININNKQAIEARIVARTLSVPFADAAHAIMSRDNSAIMITRDAHFVVLSSISKSYLPEELI